MEPMEKLRSFINDTHTLELMMLARKYKKVDIYVEHGVDEPEVVPYSELAPQLASNVNQSQGDPDGGVVTQPKQEGITIEEENEGINNCYPRAVSRFRESKLCNACACKLESWDLTGIPCPHAICVILDKGRDMEDYLDPYYSKEAYQRTYAHTLLPMNGELFWPKTNCEQILAPIPKKMTGTPKKKRNREENEGSSTTSKNTQLSRKGHVMRCSICRQEGHTRAKCDSVGGILG
nr:uncharacterized protein LOC109163527 [Ipomoea batatas]